MQKIPLDMAQPGMKLAQDVTDDKGRVLCGAGVALEAPLIEKFKQLGVRFVTVEGHPVDFPWERPLKEELALLEERFSRVTHDERLMKLKEIIKKYWLSTRSEE
ncbi:MAG: hypothetical protein GXO17_04590 [Thermodesulfobacteria bacterium]|nr:hypothetical protein [Thermodesulfobacteriota bacterium]